MRHYKPGDRFGRLVIKEIIGHPKNPKALCACDCGGVSTPQLGALGFGKAVSCGCAMRERAYRQGKANATHGKSHTRTYSIWLDARKSCFRQKDQRYAEYGGRGITMCDSWAKSFEAFYADMGEAPAGMTLERKDVDGNYEPSNCCWANRLTQARNTRRSRHLSYEIACEIRRRYAAGETGLALAKEFGVGRSNLYQITGGHTWKEPA